MFRLFCQREDEICFKRRFSSSKRFSSCVPAVWAYLVSYSYASMTSLNLPLQKRILVVEESSVGGPDHELLNI